MLSKLRLSWEEKIRIFSEDRKSVLHIVPLEAEQAMSIFAYDPFWHRSNFLLYVASVPNTS